MPRLHYPEHLPISAQREAITAALTHSQVIVVCGETGSGKTTQLPKIAWAAYQARSVPAKPAAKVEASSSPGSSHPKSNAQALRTQTDRARADRNLAAPQMLAHTQPRRVAATSIAQRLAEEFETPLGEFVGYQVRFQERLQASTQIKLMTDGILLAQTQHDPLLKRYHTIIIDEAHERNLNIDFLLGYLKRLLPLRPDLKLIITSATIDAERFATHFAQAGQPAPVFQIEGRTYPVEVRYQPYREDEAEGLHSALLAAVHQLWPSAHTAGDILIFLAGEREIREASEYLQGAMRQQKWLADTEVLPLYARLNLAAQQKIFAPGTQRRIVLTTNIAETSLTVPRIHFVIDSGTARVKRYSVRSKIEQLWIEQISQAAANQRAGRCGRIAPGICIRLFEANDFAARPAFSDPEIKRSSLAAVILRMKSLQLGAVDEFPFLDAPNSRAIHDGYQLLTELGALDSTQQLTPVGVKLAALPLDPRMARMLVAAVDEKALAEMLVITSALSVSDVRERPPEAQTQADQAHARFKDPRSEFSSLLTLWQWLQSLRAPETSVTNTAQAPVRLSQRQYAQTIKQAYLNPRRVREWLDLYRQLRELVLAQGWRLNTQPASYQVLHQALLTGLLGHIGEKMPEEEGYLGARGIKFRLHPSNPLGKKAGRWVVAAELVETTRLYARTVAQIEPQWLERVAAHLLQRQLSEPLWDKKTADVIAYERGLLYGLMIYHGRRRSYGQIDPVQARTLFIREALVAGEWQTDLPFLRANQKVINSLRQLEHQSRRQDILVDDAWIEAFYDRHLPATVYNGKTFQQWWLSVAAAQPRLLHFNREQLMRHEAQGVTSDSFPPLIRLAGVDCRAQYWHEPGSPRDGVTVDIPLALLNQVNSQRCEWLVPGMLADKVQALLKSLPPRVRSRLAPLPERAQQFCAIHCQPQYFGVGSLLTGLGQWVETQTSLKLGAQDFRWDQLSAHHLMNLRVIDQDGRQLAQGRDLQALQSEWGKAARGAFSALAQLLSTNASTTVANNEQRHSETSPTTAHPARSATSAHAMPTSAQANKPQTADSDSDSVRDPGGDSGAQAARAMQSAVPQWHKDTRYSRWTFGPWPELLELRAGQQVALGYPALVDQGDAVVIQVFDEPMPRLHQKGLLRLIALQISDRLKFVEKNLPDFTAMALHYVSLGSADELRQQIIQLALQRAFLSATPITEAAQFEACIASGRERFALIAQEIARQAAVILAQYHSVLRQLKDSKVKLETRRDCEQQLQRLMPKDFLQAISWHQLPHYARYFKGISLRLERARNDPMRDSAKMAELTPLEQRYWRLVAHRKGAVSEAMEQYRWLLEELRISFFATELRTAQPVSAKRLDKAWGLLDVESM